MHDVKGGVKLDVARRCGDRGHTPTPAAHSSRRRKALQRRRRGRGGTTRAPSPCGSRGGAEPPCCWAEGRIPGQFISIPFLCRFVRSTEFWAKSLSTFALVRD